MNSSPSLPAAEVGSALIPESVKPEALPQGRMRACLVHLQIGGPHMRDRRGHRGHGRAASGERCHGEENNGEEENELVHGVFLRSVSLWS